MPRKDRKKLGARAYQQYSQETLAKALEDIKGNNISLREAQRKYGVKKSTLSNKLRGLHAKKVGPSTTLSETEEQCLVKSVITCGDFGFPFGLTDLRMLVKTYLDRKGITVKRFKNNTPGDDWVRGFLKRHSDEIYQIVASNITPSRGGLTRKQIAEYFENLQVSGIADVPPCNLFNYDESNITDDPGKKRAIFKRGIKYPVRTIHHSKSSTTFMLCGSADGTCLPPYILYKSEGLWRQWCEGGPVGYPLCCKPCCSLGTHFGRSPHGWFNGAAFDDWFFSTFRPHARRLEGTKVLLGDNLSSHFSPQVLASAEANNITFVCLPAGSTHLLQPLDVSIFGPIKKAWRSVLLQWKMTGLHCTHGVPKEQIPHLFTNLLQNIAPNIGKNIQSGFRACGLVPFNPECVLQKIPCGSVSPDVEEHTTRDVCSNMHESIKSLLDKLRQKTPPTRGRKKRLNVPPGKSITTLHLDTSNRTDEPETDTSSSDLESDQYSVHDSTSSPQFSEDDEIVEMETNGGTEEPIAGPSGTVTVTSPNRITPVVPGRSRADLVLQHHHQSFPSMKKVISSLPISVGKRGNCDMLALSKIFFSMKMVLQNSQSWDLRP